jgi:hypothetical protein
MLAPTYDGGEDDMRRIGLTAIAAAVLALVAGPTAAGANSYPTQVKIDVGGPTGAEGHVTSPLAKCRSGRRVSLWVEDPTTGNLVEIDSTTTTPKGDWVVIADLFAGEYIAKVESKKVKAKGKQHTCKGGRSARKHL